LPPSWDERLDLFQIGISAWQRGEVYAAQQAFAGARAKLRAICDTVGEPAVALAQAIAAAGSNATALQERLRSEVAELAAVS
jgi:hypothetical protein